MRDASLIHALWLFVGTALTSCASDRGSGDRVVEDLADGRRILERACTACHGLRGLGAYREYWGEPEWRTMIETMVGYGAPVSSEEVTVLSRWLARNCGTDGSGAQGADSCAVAASAARVPNDR